jgi:hypothetical protein
MINLQEQFSSHRKIAEQTADSRTNSNTKSQYDSSIKKILNYCKLHDSYRANDIQLNLPVSKELIQAFLGSIIKFKKDGVTPNTIHTANGYINALKFEYVSKNLKMDKALSDCLEEFIKGYKRETAKQKEDHPEKLLSGKKPFTFDTYRKIASFTLNDICSEEKQMTFTHSYVIFCWNLMARSATASTLNYCNMTWENDSLAVSYSRVKNDQEGSTEIAKHTRHIFANPWDPIICPTLALAIRLVCCTLPDNMSMFDILSDEDGSRKFSDWLKRSLGHLTEVEQMDFGVHSLRKGIASHLAGNDYKNII